MKSNKTVICIDNTDTDLILYKKYKVRYLTIINGVEYINIETDDIDVHESYRFKTIDTIRKEKLDKLIK